jgi:hypothetical protein
MFFMFLTLLHYCTMTVYIDFHHYIMNILMKKPHILKRIKLGEIFRPDHKTVNRQFNLLLYIKRQFNLLPCNRDF